MPRLLTLLPAQFMSTICETHHAKTKLQTHHHLKDIY